MVGDLRQPNKYFPPCYLRLTPYDERFTLCLSGEALVCRWELPVVLLSPVNRGVGGYPLRSVIWMKNFLIDDLFSPTPRLPLSSFPHLFNTASPYHLLIFKLAFSIPHSEFSIPQSEIWNVSLSPLLPISPSPCLRVSVSLYLFFSLSPHHRVSPSPHLFFSLSPYFLISLIPYFAFYIPHSEFNCWLPTHLGLINSQNCQSVVFLIE